MFYCVRGYMFRSLVTIIRPLCESILKMLVTYWDPKYVYSLYQCIYLSYKYIKVGG